MQRSSMKALAGLGLLAAMACSGGDGDEEGAQGGDAGASGTGGSTAQGGDTGSGGSGLVSQGGNTCEIEAPELLEGCVGQAYEPETIPLDIYVMFDQSGSMISCVDPDTDAKACPDPEGPTRLDAIRTATEEFLRDPASIGIRVGIGYFGYQVGSPLEATSCEPADYADAAVPIGLLPNHADTLMESLNAIEPVGETPTGAAIRGACAYAQEHKQQNPGHKVVILLVTDGEPKTPRTCPEGTSDDPAVCCPTLADAVSAASECAEGALPGAAAGPPIETYVLGVGPFLDNLQNIAVAGGTEQAYLVEGGDVASKVQQALNAIRSEATIPCEMQLPAAPDGQQLDTGKVNIVFANAVCDAELFYKVETVEGCTTDGGWYYDDELAPSKIQLCPASCEEVSVPGGQMMFSVGCNVVEILR